MRKLLVVSSLTVLVCAAQNLPLAFERNDGQSAAEVKFLAHGPGYTLFLTPAEAVMALPQTPLRMQLLGANRAPRISGIDELAGRTNYFLGNDAKTWHTNIPRYSKVKYSNVYSGIDLIYYGNQRQLEYDFVVSPGADPHRIHLAIEGAKQISVNQEGDLSLAMPAGEIRWHKPIAYQETAGARQEIAAHYVIQHHNQVAFELSGYDTRQVLFIDPLVYSTFLGGTDTDQGYGITVDSSNNVYVTGNTWSTNFPTLNPWQSANAGINDVYVAKLDSTGTNLIYSTYIGGSGYDYGNSIAVDPAGNAYVTGWTTSPNFPTVNALQPIYMGGGTDGYDAFVVKLNPTASALVYSTYLGGNADDLGYGIAADSAGNAYIAGATSSTNFPTVNAFQPALNGASDAFLTKINPSGSAFVYSTYLGGSGGDDGYGIAVDSAGDVYVAGDTSSTDFPTVNPLQAANGGTLDAFVAKFNPEGSALIYSTYLGGANYDAAWGIAVDSSGNACIAGDTDSTDFPTVNAFQPVYGNATDAFVAKINSTGSALVYSTYLGGSGYDQANAIAVDNSSNVYVTGYTHSGNFPVSNAFEPNYRGGKWDGFVTKFNPAGSALVYSTYLGGNQWDQGFGIAVDSSENAYVTGFTSSGNFPAVKAFQAAYAGATDAFITKFASTPAFSAAHLAFRKQTVGMPSLPQTATLTNTSDTQLSLTSIHITGANSADFAQTNNCPQTLTGGGSCQITVTFTPSAAVTERAAVSVRESGPVSPVTLPMEGNGVLPTATPYPASLTFQDQSIFTTSPAQTLTLTNNGLGILVITNISATGPFSQTNTCASPVNPGANCTVSVTFTPNANGTLTGSISITDNASDSPQMVPLTGTGVSPAVVLSSSSLTFPDQTVYSNSQPQSVTLTNTATGVAYLAISGITTTGPFTQTNTCGTTVNAGASCTINVTFSPRSAGPLAGSVAIADNAPGSPQTISLNGTGTDIQFHPASRGFGTQPVGTTSIAQDIAVINKGFVTVQIASISITGANAGDFAQTNGCGSALASGASCYVTVTFTPTATGKRSAQLAVTDNGGGSPQTAPLTGTGI